jgi:hypothetical protein
LRRCSSFFTLAAVTQLICRSSSEIAWSMRLAVASAFNPNYLDELLQLK